MNFAAACLDRTANLATHPAIHSVEHGSFSYGWLAEQSRRCAQVLGSLGLGKGDRYLCLLPNIPEAAVVFLGGQLAGGIPTMAFLGYKAQELEHLYRSLSPAMVITTSQYRHGIEAVVSGDRQGQMLLVDAPSAGIPALRELLRAGPGAPGNPAASTAPDDIGAILFTSGATGPPKGVPHSHANLIRQCDTTKWACLGPGDVVYTPAPLGFAIGLHCHIHYCFYHGASSLYTTDRPAPARFLELVRQYRVTHILTASTHLWQVLTVAPQPEAMTTVKSITIGGSALNRDLFDRWYEAYGIRLEPSFAMTELLGAACGTAIGDGRPDTMGRLLPAWSARVVDPNDPEGEREVPAGQNGVLWLKGPSVLPYYWHDEETTMARLRNGWFNTNDLVYQSDSGDLHLVGRNDEIIKRAGWRISPVEIEEELKKHVGVADAAVVGVNDRTKGQAVLAAIVRSPVAPADPDTLCAQLETHLRDRLASYKVPDHYIFMEMLPRTPSGKLQRREISAQFSSQHPFKGW